jgi:hypothetical protein
LRVISCGRQGKEQTGIQREHGIKLGDERTYRVASVGYIPTRHFSSPSTLLPPPPTLHRGHHQRRRRTGKGSMPSRPHTSTSTHPDAESQQQLQVKVCADCSQHLPPEHSVLYDSHDAEDSQVLDVEGVVILCEQCHATRVEDARRAVIEAQAAAVALAEAERLQAEADERARLEAELLLRERARRMGDTFHASLSTTTTTTTTTTTQPQPIPIPLTAASVLIDQQLSTPSLTSSPSSDLTPSPVSFSPLSFHNRPSANAHSLLSPNTNPNPVGSNSSHSHSSARSQAQPPLQSSSSRPQPPPNSKASTSTNTTLPRYKDLTTHRLPSTPHTCLYPGAIYRGVQKNGRSSYDVTVTIVSVDFSTSFLCGYLEIRGLTEDWPTLTTYFDAEVVGRRWGFRTRRYEGGSSMLERESQRRESMTRGSMRQRERDLLMELEREQREQEIRRERQIQNPIQTQTQTQPQAQTHSRTSSSASHQSHLSNLSTEWGASETDDMTHWNRFPAFRSKEIQNDIVYPSMTLRDSPPSNTLSPSSGSSPSGSRAEESYQVGGGGASGIGNKERGCLFMRWKERFLVPDHRVTNISGASFAGSSLPRPLLTSSVRLTHSRILLRLRRIRPHRASADLTSSRGR